MTKKALLTVFFVFLCAALFADMDSARFSAAFNLKLGFASYAGGFTFGAMSMQEMRGADENGDGIIFQMTAGDATNGFAVANAVDGRFFVFQLSNDAAYTVNEDSGAKRYNLQYANIKEQFLKDYREAVKKIGLAMK
jgi:hypothetical protein